MESKSPDDIFCMRRMVLNLCILLMFQGTVWLCVANFSLVFSDEATVVEFRATIKPGKTSVVVKEMDSVELLCVVDSYPSSTINITKAGIVLQHRTNSYQSVFNLENAKCSDGGTYVCISLNEHLTASRPSSRSLHIYVTCKFPFLYYHLQKMLHL